MRWIPIIIDIETRFGCCLETSLIFGLISEIEVGVDDANECCGRVRVIDVDQWVKSEIDLWIVVPDDDLFEEKSGEKRGESSGNTFGSLPMEKNSGEIVVLFDVDLLQFGLFEFEETESQIGRVETVVDGELRVKLPKEGNGDEKEDQEEVSKSHDGLEARRIVQHIVYQ